MGFRLVEFKKLWGDPFFSKPPNLDEQVGEICIDSRKIKPGNFFVPIVGDNFDGHDFLHEAFEKGIQAAVINKSFQKRIPNGLLYWRVENSLKAYQQIALLHRLQFDISLIAITGSVGKTTTRELIQSMISHVGPVLSTSENNNNDIGVPLTLLQANKKHSAIVLEMGMRGLGEIERLSDCAQPDIAVITNIGTAHIGKLGTRKNIAVAKCEITSSLRSNGSVVIPADDPLLEKELKRNWSGRIIKVDVKENNSTSSENYECDYLGIVDLESRIISVNGRSYWLPLRGMHNARNFILALAVAFEMNVPLAKLDRLNLKMPKGRNTCLKIGQLTIFDETYNASPESVIASLKLLKAEPGRHIAVLGTMLELGTHSIDCHRRVIIEAVNLGLHGLIIVSEGSEAEVMSLEAEKIPLLAVVTNPKDAEPYLKAWLKQGDSLLLKGSRKIQLETLLPFLKDIFK